MKIMSNQAELAVLGCLILAPTLMPTVVDKITPADFLDPKNAATMEALADMWVKDVPIDAVSVAGRLKASNVGMSDVWAMVEGACLPGALAHHLKTICDAGALRRLHGVGSQIANLAQQETNPTVVAQHAQELLDGATRVDESHVSFIGDTLDETFALIEATGKGEVDPGIPTGFIDLDHMITGLRGGHMVIIAARPGQGKTAMVMDIMRNASIKNKIPTMIFSLEMSKLELTQRVLAAESNVLLGNIISGKVDERGWEKLGESAERLSKSPLIIDHSTGVTVTDIVAKSRVWVEKHGVKMIVVDYLQLLRADGYASREQEIASYSRAMKLLAKQCDVPVVVLAQINRESAKAGRKPQMSDLRESGALEQDADLILMLDRPDSEHKDSDRAGEVDVIVAKNRHGNTGTVVLAHQLHYSKFANMVRS